MGHLGRATCTVHLFSSPRPARNETNVPLHGLRTPNEGINQRNLKLWQIKYALFVPKNLGVGVAFRPASPGVRSTYSLQKRFGICLLSASITNSNCNALYIVLLCMVALHCIAFFLSKYHCNVTATFLTIEHHRSP